MYTPAAFHQPDTAQVLAAIQRYSFATLISSHDGAPLASHLPLLLDRAAGPHGALVGHMARANPQWQQADGQTVLAVFAGPHAYISPTWYASENVVPTWNYVAVHAYGVLRVEHDPAALLRIVAEYVRVYEAPQPQPWQFNPASEFNQKLLAAIVGFRIEINRIDAKWKLNQNHPAERREKVIAALSPSADANDQAIADLMRATLQ